MTPHLHPGSGDLWGSPSDPPEWECQQCLATFEYERGQERPDECEQCGSDDLALI